LKIIIIKILITARNAEYICAVSFFPVITESQMASGTVLVTPSIFPAIIIVIPNSPRPLRKPRSIPARTPFLDSGRSMYMKICHLLAPAISAAEIRTMSIESINVLIDL
jgi:hypothetical protein